ncbi:methyltransferase, TIGR04325 family [Leptospira limi]|uniref:Methyltransferase, TIGR04325 family n=1 Tax=Leptospira limi TaxID=2950023 RepID=A0ABT3LZ30_9LEPT|nr:methyltransferase, TIGR04325 family [Leptospira limi]MCW7462987.1 methyltransferase, TIGR04325 family [Leptospira limi]
MSKKINTDSKSIRIWDGVYSTWEKAVSSAGGQDGKKGFSNERWFDRIVDQLISFREEIKKFGIAVPPRPTNLPTVCSMVKPEIIVDLGGSSGWIYDYLTSVYLPNKIKKYTILEVPDIVSRHKKFTHTSKVKYSSDYSKLSNCDLFYTNSVIQYFPTNEHLLNILSHLNPKYILVDDLYAGDNKEFFSNQISYEKRIPHRFLNFRKFKKDVESLGYKLILKQPFHTPILGVYQSKPMDHFPKEYRLRYSLSVLFQRIR